MKRALGATVALVGSLVVSSTAFALVPASDTPGPTAGADCDVFSRALGRCSVRVTVPGSDELRTETGSEETGSRGSSGADDSSDASAGKAPAHDEEGTPVCTKDDKPVPCASDHGFWRQDVQCYISPVPLDPQPEEGSAVWEVFAENFSRGPDTGAVYPCFDAEGNRTSIVYSDETPQAEPLPPSPGEVARQVAAGMNLKAIRIGIAPPEGGVSVVGTPVWLWVDDPDATTFGPTSATATVRGVTVTATARVESVRWDLGDGTTITCGKGTPYEPRFGAEPSPDCGHVYTRESGSEPQHSYTVTAATRFVVEWSGVGQTGTITMDPLVAQTQLVVAEGQVLVR
ncbi:hypothetical protein [Myceligenerans crystallogenes]